MIVKEFTIQRAIALYDKEAENDRMIAYYQESLFKELGIMIAQALKQTDLKLMNITLELKREEWKTSDPYAIPKVIYGVKGVMTLV